MKRILSAFFVFVLLISTVACKSDSVSLTDEYKRGDNTVIDDTPAATPNVTSKIEVAEKANSPEEAVGDFGVELFRESYDGEKNTLISPASVSLALAMTSGGSAGESYAQFEALLGRGVEMNEMYDFLKEFSEKLDDSEKTDINLANSVWIRDNKNMISVKQSFLEFADEYFDAEVFLSPFNKSTVRDINSWVKEETDGMIKNIIDDIDALTVMYLINALSFEAEWESRYTDTNERFIFTNKDGEKERTTGMVSTERYFLKDDNTTGFVKPYKGDEFSFVVLLPNDDIDIDSYVASLTGEKIRGLLENKENVAVETVLPKFSFEYEISLNSPLKNMGLTYPFDSSLSDLSNLGSSDMGNLYVSNVLHKTFIEVAEKGTKAAAVTAVEVKCESAMIAVERKEVKVDRPFVFMIIENSTDLPMFIGATLSVE